MSAPVIINFGGGTNSTALLIGYVERGLPITGVVFADPGSEMPHTYENVAFMSKWLEDRGYPGIAVVRNQRKDGIKSLEERCEVRRDLPSIATTSIRWSTGTGGDRTASTPSSGRAFHGPASPPASSARA